MDCQKYVLWKWRGQYLCPWCICNPPKRGTPVVRPGGGLWSSSQDTEEWFLKAGKRGCSGGMMLKTHPWWGQQLLEGQVESPAGGTPLGSRRWGWQRVNTEGEMERPSRGWMGEPRLRKSCRAGWQRRLSPGRSQMRWVLWQATPEARRGRIRWEPGKHCRGHPSHPGQDWGPKARWFQ